MTRPTFSVIMPFLGDLDEAQAAAAALARVRTEEGDELIVADNTPDGLVSRVAPAPVRVVDVSDRRSASHARNVGAAAARGDWLLFVDADCELPGDLLERYAALPLKPTCAVIAGEVVGSPRQTALLARWARSRRGKWVSYHLSSGPFPAGATANMLVRRTAWEELGGFRIGGGGDLDLSWRAQQTGWSFEYRPDVVVEHNDRERLRDLLKQAYSYGSHQSRLRKLHGPGVPKAKLAMPLARAVGGAIVWTIRGKREKAAFKLIDGVWAVVLWWGELTGGPGARQAD